MKLKVLAKIVAWTLVMAVAAFLIMDGKGTTPFAGEHMTAGAVIGFLFGCFFVWQQRER